MKSLRRILKKPARKTEYLLKSIFAKFLRNSFFVSRPRLYLSFDAAAATDGTGAQLQRQITIFLVAKYFGLSYVHNPIRQVAVHPLDPFQSENEYNEYLRRLNAFLNLPNFGNNFPNLPERQISRLTFSVLARELFSTFLFRQPRLLSVHEPYPVSEFCPGLLDNHEVKIIENFRKRKSDGVTKIVIHYRQGVGGYAIYPGQRIPREIYLEKFGSKLAEIESELPRLAATEITVLTDAPDTETKYVPPRNQIELWEGTPGFSNGEMTIKPTSFEYLNKFSALPLRIIRGGDPLEAIQIMSNSDILLIGKSSLSFVGGLLNQMGQIYCPTDFWHRPMKHWKPL
jgi:hypothetical protein